MFTPVIKFSRQEELFAGEAKISPDDTTIFFDWDDTFLASSWLIKNGYSMRNVGPINQEFLEMGESLSAVVQPLLIEAMKLGRVAIVTNATDGWIKLSCMNFMPKILSVVSYATLVSAQGRYGHIYPDSLVDWKRYTFEDVLKAETRPVGKMRNLISIGDGMAEHLALQALKGNVLGSMNIVKSVKFLETPSIKQLVEQLEKLRTVLKDIVQHPTSIDLRAYESYVPPLPPSPPQSCSGSESSVKRETLHEKIEIEPLVKQVTAMSTAIRWFENRAFDAPELKSPQPCIHGSGCVFTMKNAEGKPIPACCRFVHPGEEGTGRRLFPERTLRDTLRDGEGKIVQPACVRLVGKAGFYERQRLRMPWQEWCARQGIPFTPNKPGVFREPVKRIQIGGRSTPAMVTASKPEPLNAVATADQSWPVLAVPMDWPAWGKNLLKEVDAIRARELQEDYCDDCGKLVDDCPERGDHGDEKRDYAYSLSQW
jgi:hypothetical protein